ncbi:MAG: hypothetical protein AAFU79_28280 [Myxococcota bacterium]
MALSRIGTLVRSTVTSTKTIADHAKQQVAAESKKAVDASESRTEPETVLDHAKKVVTKTASDVGAAEARNIPGTVLDHAKKLIAETAARTVSSGEVAAEARQLSTGDGIDVPATSSPVPFGPPAPPPQDRWEPDSQNLRNALKSGDGPGEVEVSGLGTLPLHVPASTYANGFTEEGEPASYSTNWHLEEDDWATVGMVRGVSEIPTTSSADMWAELAAASAGVTAGSTLNPVDYQGAVLLPDGTLGRAHEAAPELFVEHPVFLTPPNDTFTPGSSQPILPPLEKSRQVSGPTFQSEIARSDQQRMDFVGAIASGTQLGIDLGNAYFNTRNRNYYATQTLIQQNDAGEQRAVVIATQVKQPGTLNPTGHPEVRSHFVSVDSNGEVQLTPVQVPTQFVPGNLETGGVAPPIGTTYEDIERYGAVP